MLLLHLIHDLLDACWGMPAEIDTEEMFQIFFCHDQQYNHASRAGILHACTTINHKATGIRRSNLAVAALRDRQ
jgi:hypothetical protein